MATCIMCEERPARPGNGEQCVVCETLHTPELIYRLGPGRAICGEHARVLAYAQDLAPFGQLAPLDHAETTTNPMRAPYCGVGHHYTGGTSND